jgi:3-methyladenine DNA glycosylase AlkD
MSEPLDFSNKNSRNKSKTYDKSGITGIEKYSRKSKLTGIDNFHQTRLPNQKRRIPGLKPIEILTLELSKQKPSAKTAFMARYQGGVGHEDRKKDEQSSLQFIGLNIKQVDAICFAQSIFFNSKTYEEMCCALKIVKTLENRHQYASIWQWAHYVDNWPHSDSLSDFYSRLLEGNFPKYKKYFESWNKSKNPWHRRQSMVGMLNYAYFRKTYPPFAWMKKMVLPHIEDSHYYVQKAVGWTLREMQTAYPKEGLVLIEQLAPRLSPVAWVAAAERLPNTKRKKLLLARKKWRKR